MPDGPQGIPEHEIAAWADFRYQMRVWNRIAEQAAHEVGIAPQHQQVLLAVRGFPGGPPRIVDLAERMQVQHHSMVGLLDRMEAEGLIVRSPRTDGRGVSILITPDGEEKIARVLAILRPRLATYAARLVQSLSVLVDETSGAVLASPRSSTV